MGSGAMGTQVGTGTHGEVVMKGKVDDEQSGPDGSGAAKVPAGTASRPAGGAATWVPRKWELIIIVLTVAPMAGFTVINPYQQTLRAELGCDAVCMGTMTSASSALGLFGSPLVGALSDHMGRRAALVIGALASAVGFTLVGFATSMPLLWLSVIPGSLLAHNFTIAKALVADLAPPEERAGIMGKLGLAAGLGFMVGPLVNPFVTTRMQACMFATGVNLFSVLTIFQLPAKAATAAHGEEKKVAPKGLGAVFTTVWEAIKEVFVLAVAAPASARVILVLRFGLSMGFHLFYTVMQMLLKDRFHFQPADYSNYFAFIGLTYAFSQIVSRGIINRFGKDQTMLLVICLFSLLGGRLLSAITTNTVVFYSAIAFTIFALGIVNTSVNTTITRIASDSNVGGLMGVLDTSEKLAGIVGPAIGGALYAYYHFAPVIVVCAGYVALALIVYVGFPRYVIPAIDNKEKDSAEVKAKTE